MKKIYVTFITLFSFSIHGMDNKKDIHYETYKKRFPQARKSYKEYTDDYILFLNHAREEITQFKKRSPNVFLGTIKIVALGCHDGDTSKSVVEIVQTHGAQDILFHGVDPYPTHVHETSSKLKECKITDICIKKDDLDQYAVPENEKGTAHVILVEQICHHVNNLEQFIQKITQLAAPQSIILFGHTDDSTSISNQMFSKLIGGTKYITTNVCPGIRHILKKDGHTFSEKIAKQKLNLPKISKQTRNFLYNIKGNDYQNSYENFSEADRKVKDVVEFCITQPTEKLATSWFKKKILLTALLAQFGKTIDLDYTIHVIYFDKK